MAIIKNIGQETLINYLKRVINSNSDIFLSLSSLDPSVFKYLKNEFSKSLSFNLLLKKSNKSIDNKDWKVSITEYFKNLNYDDKTIEDSVEQSDFVKEYHDFLLNSNNVKIKLLKDNSNFDGQIIVKNGDEIHVFNDVNELNEGILGIPEKSKTIKVRYHDKTNLEDNRDELESFNDVFNNPKYIIDNKNEYLDKLTFYFNENTPDFVYHYSLLNIFSNQLDEILKLEDEKMSDTGFKNTEIWNRLFNFQKDGVIACLNKLNRYGGCIIADSVGLGKTFSALAIIKQYELRNNNVLVICPKRLRDNWNSFKQNYKGNILANDRFRYDILNHTDLIRTHGKSGDLDLSQLNRGNYDLIVIDESHNFRNNNGYNKQKNLETIDGYVTVADSSYKKRTSYTSLLEEFVKAGVKSHVLLLTATPINNKFNDLEHQIEFITKGNDQLFEKDGVDSIRSTFKFANNYFRKWKTLPLKDRTLNNFIQNVDSRYFKLLDLISIARSRDFIKKYYPQEDVGGFPKHLQPNDWFSSFKSPNEDIDFATFIYNLMNELELAAYQPISYLNQEFRDEIKKQFENRKQSKTDVNYSIFEEPKTVEEELLEENDFIDINNEEYEFSNPLEIIDHSVNRIKGQLSLLIVNLFKRLESSIYSFNQTLDSYISNAKIFKKFLENEISFETYLQSNQSLKNFVEKLNSIGIKIELDYNYFDLNTALLDVNHDLEIYEKIKIYTDSKVIDEKLKTLKDVITNKIREPFNENNKKIILFTAFADTAEYLYDQLSDYLMHELDVNSALITGNSSKTNYLNIKNNASDILEYFSPLSKGNLNLSNKKQIDVLICTDVISEGQNLQDCDCIINYDIHWNPVRVIQRFGRIDRIGSKNNYIKMINFWPTASLDKYLNLVQKVKEKTMIAALSTTGENILSDEEKADLEYRNLQIRSIYDGKLDESINGDLNITDLNLSEYKIDLLKYCNKHENEIINKPIGLYGCVSEMVNIKPGAIFLFKNLDNQTKQNKTSLYPYYLIYVNKNGNIELNPEQYISILRIYKQLCFNKTDLDIRAIDIFNEETHSSLNMSKYVNLAKIALNSIENKQENNQLYDLLSTYQTSLINESNNKNQNILISYLIIE